MNPSTLSLGAMTTIINTEAKKLFPKVQPSEVYKDYLKYMTKVEVNDRQEVESGITDLSMSGFIPDGGIPSPDAPIAGFQKTYTQQQMRKDARITYQTYFWMFKNGDRSKITQGLGKALEKKIIDPMNSIEKAKEYLGQCLLQQGFNTSFTFVPVGDVTAASTTINTTTADGVEYWSRNHLREDGGANWSTVIEVGATPSPVPSIPALEAMHQLQALKKDGRGAPLASAIDTIVVRKGTQAHMTLLRIKKMLDKGMYPSNTPGTNGSFNEATTIDSFEIIALKAWENTALSALSWGGFDSTMNNEEYGFTYRESDPTHMVELPVQTNYDYLLSATSMFTMGATDLRNWMWSAGDGTTF